MFSNASFRALIAVAAVAIAGPITFAQDSKPQEFYELRSYLIDTPEDHAVVGKYVELSLIHI